jgi:hypothetical protein
MANKHIPDSIAGVELHPLTRSPASRTRKLLKTLASRGVKGVDDDGLSMIDKFRLLASAYLTLSDAIVPDPEHRSKAPW